MLSIILLTLSLFYAKISTTNLTISTTVLCHQRHTEAKGADQKQKGWGGEGRLLC